MSNDVAGEVLRSAPVAVASPDPAREPQPRSCRIGGADGVRKGAKPVGSASVRAFGPRGDVLVRGEAVRDDSRVLVDACRVFRMPPL